MARVTQAHLDARRQEIIAAATACFVRSGFHQATMQDICREAGLSAGAVYRYFHSKDEIIEACCEEGLQRSLDLIAGHEEQRDGLTASHGLVDAFFGELKQAEPLCSYALDIDLWAEATRNPRVRSVVQRMFSSLRERLAALYAEAQASGEIASNLDPEALARAAISLFEGLVLQMMLEPELEIGPYVAVVKAMLVDSLWQGAAGTINRSSQPSPSAEGDASNDLRR